MSCSCAAELAARCTICSLCTCGRAPWRLEGTAAPARMFTGQNVRPKQVRAVDRKLAAAGLALLHHFLLSEPAGPGRLRREQRCAPVQSLPALSCLVP